MSTGSFGSSYVSKEAKVIDRDIYHEGSIINNQYRVEKRLTDGAIGRVYKCLDMTANREMVLKSIDADPFLQPEKQDELIREIQNWMRLPRCSNLVNIISVFYDNAEQTLFFTMPYIEGHKKYGLELQDWMRTYRFTEADILYLGIAVCNAMKECRIKTGKLPVHGDIKPSNIFLEYRGERFKDEAFLSCNIRLADCGAIGRTRLYFPKEYEDCRKAPNWASDVYALIMVMHEMEKYTVEGYDHKNSAVRLIYELLILQEQWKIYNLVEVLDDFLLPGFRVRFRIEPVELLYKDIQMRSIDIFNRVHEIHSQLQMMYKDDTLLEEIDKLWKEAEKEQYLVNDVPLTCYIDRDYFVCAALCAQYELAEKVLCRYEKALLALPERQRKIFGYTYSENLDDDFKILHAQYNLHMNQKDLARTMFHNVELKNCICYNWLEQYIDICEERAIEGQFDEGQYLKEKLRKYIKTYGGEREIRTLCELKMHLGALLRSMGETKESVEILEECVQEYPDDLEFMYQYGYALMLDGQVSRARYPLNLLHFLCQQIRKRNKTIDGHPLYPAQTIASYSHMAAYLAGDFPVALKELEELDKQFLYYQGYVSEVSALAKQMVQESYDAHYQLRRAIVQMSAEDICQNYVIYFTKWKKYLDAPLGCQAYFFKRGELQVLMDLHTMFADLMLASRHYDELIEACNHMLSILKDSGMVKLYLARAHAMKGEVELAARFYRESADMLPYEYPQVKRDGTETVYVQREKARMREEMKKLGIDAVI